MENAFKGVASPFTIKSGEQNPYFKLTFTSFSLADLNFQASGTEYADIVITTTDGETLNIPRQVGIIYYSYQYPEYTVTAIGTDNIIKVQIKTC